MLVGLLADVRQLPAQRRVVADRAPEQGDDAAEFRVAKSHGFVVGLRGVIQPGLGVRLSLFDELHELRHSAQEARRFYCFPFHTLYE